MDPALWELLRREPSDEVEAVVRLTDPAARLPGLRIIARFGSIATCRIPAGRVIEAREHEAVASLKAPRYYGPEQEPGIADDTTDVRPADARRPAGLRYDGSGVVVGMLDWGFAFANPTFRHPDGRTRLLALWDQRGHGWRGNRYGYGTIHSARALDAALRMPDPYAALGHHPAASDPRGTGAHGTHTADIAAGNGRGGGPVGVAPGADLVCVHLATESVAEHPLEHLGDSVRVLEAIDFVRRVAGGRPFVINASIGRHGGPHDGTTLIDWAIDALLRERPDAMCIHSAGNYREKGCHASGRLRAGEVRTWRFVTDASDRSENEIEVWYGGDAAIALRLETPAGESTDWITRGDIGDLRAGDRTIGRAYHRARDPQNGDNMVDVFLDGDAAGGEWRLHLRGDAVPPDGVAVHAWIERDEACGPCQARFHHADACPKVTTSTLANGESGISVGAVDGASGALAPFSSWGPSRDGRRKPDCVAPGVAVLAARSPPFGARGDGLVRRNGTSMAAPHVAGCAALVLEAARGRLGPGELRELLLSSVDASDEEGHGHGRVSVTRAVAAAEAMARRRDTPATRRFVHPVAEITPMPATDHRSILVSSVDDVLRGGAPLSTDELLALVLERALGIATTTPARHVFRGLRSRVERPWGSPDVCVLAAPGEPFASPPLPGDVIVRRARGEGRLAHVAVIASPEMDRVQLRTAGLTPEDDGPGWFAQVVEGGAWPHALGDRFARRVRCPSQRGMPDQVVLRLVPAGALAGATGVPVAPAGTGWEVPYDEEWADDTQPIPESSEYWIVPADVRAAGESQTITYDDAPDWDASQCTGSLTVGCSDLGRYLQATFAGISSIGGYACRQNTATPRKMSLHGTGRALDIMIPEVGGGANSSVGDPISGWLVRNATSIGVQYLIWNRMQWSGRRAKFSRYTGPNAHTDHVHTELNLAGAARRTPWFADATVQTVLASAGAPPPRTAPRGAPSRVRFAQRVLNAVAGERLADDGELGPKTREALERFRARNGLGAGGVLDEPTELALVQRALEEIARQSMFARPGVRDTRTDEAIAAFKSGRGLGTSPAIDAAMRDAVVAELRRGGATAPTAPAPATPAPRAPAPAPAGAVDWTTIPVGQRMQYVMHRLVERYGYPVPGAAGMVGNLYAESQVLPMRVEGSKAATPMRARDHADVVRDFTPEEIMNRVYQRSGPKLPGVGLAQWTTRDRRRRLFEHTFEGRTPGAGILFDMDAQVDYLVTELGTAEHRAVDAVLRDPGVTVDAASDEVVYNFERPAAIFDTSAKPWRKLPPEHPAVRAVFDERRRHSRRAQDEYRA